MSKLTYGRMTSLDGFAADQDSTSWSSRRAERAQSDKTRIVREFQPEDIERLKAESAKDISVAGPTPAAHFINAGLVDEYALYRVPVVVGAGNPVFKDIGRRLDLDLIEERSFATGMAFMRYAPRNFGMSA